MTHIKYHRLPQPFFDIAIIQTKTLPQAYSIIEKLKPCLDILRIKARIRHDSNCIIISVKTLEINPDVDQILFSGSGIIKKKFHYGPKIFEAIPDEPIGNEIGLFTAYQLNRDEITAYQDFFGYGQNYYYCWPEGALVTNRLHLAAIILAEAGLPRIPNHSFINTLVLDYSFFSQQPFTHETAIQGLQRLAINYNLRIYKGEVHLIEKTEWAEIFSGAGRYKTHLSNAKNEVLHTIEAITANDNFTKTICELSGGKDSRMVLAAIIANQKLKTSIYTTDIPGSKDLMIACAICEIFSLKLYCNDYPLSKPISQNTYLSTWRSYFLGEYNLIQPIDVSCFGKNNKEVYFSGGGGELLRGYWHKIIPYQTSDSLGVIIQRLLKEKETYLHMASDHLQLEITEYLTKQLKAFEQPDPVESLTRHYLFFRNRTHFGLRLSTYNLYHQGFSWIPLMSKSLIKARYCLSQEESMAGKLVYDFIASHNKRLASIEYDIDFPYANKKRRIFYRKKISNLTKKMAEWQANRIKESTDFEKIYPNMNQAEQIVQDRFIHTTSATALARLNQMFPQHTELFNILRISLNNKFAKQQKKALTLASKIIALQDIFLPLPKYQAEFAINDLEIEQYINPLKLVSITFHKDKILVRYSLFSDINPNNYEFSCYLLKENVRQSKIWYQPYQQYQQFEFAINPDNQTATVFARHKSGNIYTRSARGNV